MIFIFRDGSSVSPLSNSLLDEIAYLHTVETDKSKLEVKSEIPRQDSISSGSGKQVKTGTDVKDPRKDSISSGSGKQIKSGADVKDPRKDLISSESSKQIKSGTDVKDPRKDSISSGSSKQIKSGTDLKDPRKDSISSGSGKEIKSGTDIKDPRKDSISSGSGKQVKAKTNDPVPVILERKQKSPVKEEDSPPLVPERKKSQTKVEETVVPKAEIKLEATVRKPDQAPPKPERTFDYDRKDGGVSVKPERKQKSPIGNEEKVVIDADHSKPGVPPKPNVPPKPSAVNKPVIPPRTLTSEASPPKASVTAKPIVPPRSASFESNKITSTKPKTPPKPAGKPIPPPRPDKAPDNNTKDTEQGKQISDISKTDKERTDSFSNQSSNMSKTDNEKQDLSSIRRTNISKIDAEKKYSFSNQSANSSNQDLQTKRFSSVSASAALTLNQDQCDGEAFIKGRSPAVASTVRSQDSRHSAHCDNFLKPLCVTNNLSTSVGFLVEKKHCPVPKPKTDTQSKDKTKDVVARRQLHRSHSDLSSCRHSRTSSDFSDLSSRMSRTSTEVERFFSEMGIDRTILDPMFRLHDNARDNLDSFSSLDSQEARSVSSRISYGGDLDKVPAESEQDLMERSTTGTSVVERNARIIKWLCNVKKAKIPKTEDTPKLNKVANI